MELRIHGNIAVKPVPIRLLALCTLGSENPNVPCTGPCSRQVAYCGAQTAPVNRLTAWQDCALACNHPSGDNCSLHTAATGFAATLLQEINDCRCQHAPRHCR